MEFEIPQVADEQLILPDAAPFPPTAHPQIAGTQQQQRSSHTPEYEQYSEAAKAPIRRRRGRQPRALPLDERMELRNADLASWRDDYLANMADAAKARRQHQAPAIAKQNAAQWVVGAGIGGIGILADGIGSKTPLNIFAGSNLLDMLIGPAPVETRRKRQLDEESDSETDTSSQRKRMLEQKAGEIGLRDEQPLLPEDDLNLQPGDVSLPNCSPFLPGVELTFP